MNKECESFIKDYSKAILCGKASLFIGSGLSRSANYAGWKDVLKECADEIGLNVDKEERNLITLAQYYVNSKTQKTKIISTIRDFFDDKQGNPTLVHNKIVTLPISDIWTTNYDTLLERSFQSINIQCNVLTDDNSYQNINKDARVFIHKIHGTVERADQCIITRSDYEKFEETHDVVLAELKGKMCCNSFLFLGYGFNDTDIQHILTKIRLVYKTNNPQRHYCIIEKIKRENYPSDDEFNYESTRQRHHVTDMQSYGINVILVESYDEIKDILSTVNDKVLSKNVSICGAYEDSYLYADRTSQSAQKIARDLIKSGFTIYSGYGKNLGADIVTGAFDGCTKKEKSKEFKESVYLFPFPYKKVIDEERQLLYSQLRKNYISMTRITIVFAGKKNENGGEINSNGVIEEANIALDQGNLVIPIPTTGGVAMAIYDKMIKNGVSYTKSDDFIALRKMVSPTEIRDTVLKIIKDNMIQ